VAHLWHGMHVHCGLGRRACQRLSDLRRTVGCFPLCFIV
jgi:hypothetical protein